MDRSGNYSISINVTTGGLSGHANVTFNSPVGGLAVGANQSLGQGKYLTEPMRNVDSVSVTYATSKESYNEAIAYALSKLGTEYNYGLGNNRLICTDFVTEIYDMTRPPNGPQHWGALYTLEQANKIREANLVDIFIHGLREEKYVVYSFDPSSGNGVIGFNVLGEPRYEIRNYTNEINSNDTPWGHDSPSEHGPGPGVGASGKPSSTKADPDFDYAGFRDPGKAYSGYDTPSERGPGPGQQSGDRGGERGGTATAGGAHAPAGPTRNSSGWQDGGAKAPFAPEPPPSRDWAGGHLKGFEDDGSPVYAPPHTANSDYGLDSPRERISLDMFPKMEEKQTHYATASSSHGGDGPAKPILIDLDGDGLEIVSGHENFVLFDTDDTGLIHRTAWAGEGDGVLFFDADRDGAISSAREYIFTEWDPTAGGDIQAVRNRFDTNGDGRLTAADAAFADFKIMVTLANGTTRAMTLAEAGISGIDLLPNAVRRSVSRRF